MASQKRRGSARGNLRGTLGNLISSALAQAGGVREVLERGAREGRNRLDSFRSSQKRTDALAELGEIVLDLVRRGEIDLEELPEARAVIRELDELDAAEDDDREDAVATPPARARFDTRGAAPAARDRPREDRRPHERDDRRERDDDGTTSSARWTPPRAAAPARVWRPAVDDAPAEPAARRVPLPKDPHRKGGISFGDDDDEDLAAYMHPDDVPAKPRDDD